MALFTPRIVTSSSAELLPDLLRSPESNALHIRICEAVGLAMAVGVANAVLVVKLHKRTADACDPISFRCR
jgi:hypothetical protein